MCLVLAAMAITVPAWRATGSDVDTLKLIVGYVAAASSSDFVLVLDRDGYPGQIRGTKVRFALAPDTRVIDGGRRVAAAAITVRRAATVLYDDTKGRNVAREVRLTGALPPGVALPGAEADSRPSPSPALSHGNAERDAWRTSYDAFISDAQQIVQASTSPNAAFAARFQGQRVTWDGELTSLVTREGVGGFWEIGFPQRRLRLRDGSIAFIGFAVPRGSGRTPMGDSKAIGAVLIPLSDVVPTVGQANIPKVLRVSLVLKRVWIQPIDPRENPKLAGNSTFAIETQSPRLVTKLDVRPSPPHGR